VKQGQNDQDDGNNDQNMNPVANVRETRADSSTEEAEQPKYDQDDDNYPQKRHDISPFE